MHRMAMLEARHERPSPRARATHRRNPERGQSRREHAGRRVERRACRALPARSARVQRARRSPHGARTLGRRRGGSVARARARLARDGRRRRSVHAVRSALASLAGPRSRRAIASAPKRRLAAGSRCSRICRPRGATCRRHSRPSASRPKRSRRGTTTSRCRETLSPRWTSRERCSRLGASTSWTRSCARGGTRVIRSCSTGRATSAVMLDRERGRIAESVAALAIFREGNGLSLVRADGLARVGRLAEARAIFERVGHPQGSSPPGSCTAPEARGFTWSHALEADALVRAGDTTPLARWCDSIARSGKQSYYGRDKVLHHHVRGVLFLAQGRFARRRTRAGRRRVVGERMDAHERRDWRVLVSRSAVPTARSRRSATRSWPRSTRWLATSRARSSIGGCRARSPPRTNPTARRSTPRTCREAWRNADPALRAGVAPLMIPGWRPAVLRPSALGVSSGLVLGSAAGGHRAREATNPYLPAADQNGAARTAGSRRAGSSSFPRACRSSPRP